MFEQMKQLNQLRKMQKEMASKTFEAKSNDGLVTVTVKGDMSVKSIKIEPAAMDVARPDRLANTLVSQVNSALESAKKSVAADMSKMTGGLGGLAGLMKG